uniref:Uncharacterized protein n=1 Tax=Ditylenchus dipsaci TaxID=166011 RepID=A0A915DB95_9BILA
MEKVNKGSTGAASIPVSVANNSLLKASHPAPATSLSVCFVEKDYFKVDLLFSYPKIIARFLSNYLDDPGFVMPPTPNLTTPRVGNVGRYRFYTKHEHSFLLILAISMT